jgi:hypothetical protein
MMRGDADEAYSAAPAARVERPADGDAFFDEAADPAARLLARALEYLNANGAC